MRSGKDRRIVHELGVLRHAIKTVERIARERQIRQIKHITLEVGEASGYVPFYLQKLFPVAAELADVTKGAQLKLVMAPGRGLLIKDIGY